MRTMIFLTAIVLALMFASTNSHEANIATFQPKARFEPKTDPIERYELERYFLEHPSPSLVEIQYRLLDPKARETNGIRLCQETQEFNKVADKWTQEFSGYRTVYDIRPEILLPFLQEMKARLDRLEEILNHYDEVQK